MVHKNRTFLEKYENIARRADYNSLPPVKEWIILIGHGESGVLHFVQAQVVFFQVIAQAQIQENS